MSKSPDVTQKSSTVTFADSVESQCSNRGLVRTFRKMRYVKYSFEDLTTDDQVTGRRRRELEGELAAIRIDVTGDLAAMGPAIEEENGGLSYFIVNSTWLNSLVDYLQSSDQNGQSEREAAHPGKIMNEPIARKIYEQR